ncbi:MAG TPA: Xaa-Pro peptidase family protein [Syntrophorhabdaceae bacterium]|nr:Xaa-Pro peptidase family protein [Syntrophorhabdaceae bacterium]HQM81826.1 Xaa-Pro peptidase family protein [Syntrophorhabdaceae bacterium]
MIEDVWVFDRVPEEDLRKRIEGMKRLMAKGHIDLAIIFQNVDRFYFTNSIQKGILVIPVDREPILFVEKSVERAKTETPLEIIPIRSDKEIKKMLDSSRLLEGRAGLELDVLPVATFERLKRVIGFGQYGDISALIKELRAVKSPFEIEQLKKSGRMLSHVFAKAKEVVREGATELDIDATLVAEGRKLGHQGFLRMRGINQEMMTLTVQCGFTGAVTPYADVPIGGAGLTPALPQGSSLKRVEKGIPVTIDYGGGYNGYVTDETRVFVAGELKEIFRRPYEVAREIMEDIQSYAKEGVDCVDIFSRSYRIAEKAHLQDYFMGCGKGQVSFIGHGLGLEINELPVITARHGRALKEGMVFAFEPKFVLPPHGAIGIELDFIVRKNGLERLTDDPVDIVYV